MEDIKPFMGKFRKLTGVTPRFDGMLSVAFGKMVIDLFRLDSDLSRADPDYDNEAATYKGVECSMEDYIYHKWGEEGLYLINKLL